MEVSRIELPEDGGPRHLRLNPLKTDRVEFNVYSLQPWQALPMHSHPDSDEVFYVIEGDCVFYVENDRRQVGTNHAVYVHSGSQHAILSCGRGATLISVQGPQPVASIYGKGREYFCPVCQLETPLTTGVKAGDIRQCPRCRSALKLIRAGEAFDAEVVEARAPGEARA